MIARIVCLAVAAILPLPSALADGAAQGPSALVTLTQLKEGSLPRVLNAYGVVRASNTGGTSLMAPGSAVVGAVRTHLGQRVRAGASLLTLMPSSQSGAAYQQAESSLTVAEDLVRNTRQLLRLHLATGQQLAQAEKSQSDARATLAALRAAGAGGGHVVRAPFTAVVTGLSVHPGDIVSAGSPMLTLAAPDRLVLAAGVVPAVALRIHAGDAAAVKATGADQWMNGRVVLCGAATDPSDGLVPVQVALPPGKFLPGEFAVARITTAEVRGYVVPHKAILINNSGATYVVQAVNGIAHKVPVRVLDEINAMNVISGALDPHAPVVLTGNYQLDDGMRIRLTDPARSGATQ